MLQVEEIVSAKTPEWGQHGCVFKEQQGSHVAGLQ